LPASILPESGFEKFIFIFETISPANTIPNFE